MKARLCAVIYFFSLGMAGWAEPLIDSEMPSGRVKDPGEFLTAPARTLLGSTLDAIYKDQKAEFYIVILQKESAAEAVELCDRWQLEWVPKGQGGVFVYSTADRKYCFTPSKDTMETVGEEKLQGMFRDSVEAPPLRQSLDLVISLPVMRIVSALGGARQEQTAKRMEEAESQYGRWQVIAGMVGAFALVGWILCFSKLLKMGSRSSNRINIPPPGMAYRNPARKSRSGRRSRSESQSEESGSGESEEKRSRKDRY